MPAVISTLFPPDRGNVTPEASQHQPPSPGSSNSSSSTELLYLLALSALALVVVVRLGGPKASPKAWTWLRLGARRELRKDYGRNALARSSGFTSPRPRSQAQGQQAHKQHSLPIWPPLPPPVMEKSRGISSNAANDISQDGSPAPRDGSRSPSPPPTTGPDGSEEEKSTMDSWADSQVGGISAEARRMAGSEASAGGPSAGSIPDFSTSLRHHFMARPPPPPLTPPTLATAVFPFEDRRPSYAVSIPAELDALSPLSFLHQPNPDYVAAGSSTDAPASSPGTPRRKSYTKTLPIGIPAASDAAAREGGEVAEGNEAFAPSSFPASALLPPPPPGHNHDALYEAAMEGGEIDLQGEIISVLDAEGSGWKRHTRVYGGGVCLACMAAGGGGFYGDKVPEEHKR